MSLTEEQLQNRLLTQHGYPVAPQQKTLLSDNPAYDELPDLVERIRLGLTAKDKRGYPRYGIIGKIAEMTPVFVYDHCVHQWFSGFFLCTFPFGVFERGLKKS
jgi:hypothetical protein